MLGVLCYHRTYCSALRGQEEFRKAYHAAYLRYGREEVSKRNAKRLEEALAETLAGYPVQVACCFQWVSKMVAWLTV